MERRELELHQDQLENQFHAERFAKWMALSKAEWRAKQEAAAEAVAEGHIKVNTRPQQRE
jgi:hypothetical protein